MSETDFTLYFMHASLNREPPRTVGSGAEVRQWISAALTGVGFIWASQVDNSVKVVAIDGNLPGESAYTLRMK